MSPAAQPTESTSERKKRLARERQRRHREKVRAQQRATTSNPSNRQSQSHQQQSTNRDSQPNRISVNNLGHPNQHKSILQPQSSSTPSQPNHNPNHTQHISHLHSTTPEKTLVHYNTSPPSVSLPQAQQQQQQHLLHSQQQSKQQQQPQPQHIQFTSQSLLLQPHASSFPTTSHPFGNPTNQVQSQQLPPSHPQQEPTFAFSSPHDPNVTHQYVSDPHRQYPQDTINVNPRQHINRMQAPRNKSRSSQSIPQNQDPATSLNALPNSLNAIHGSGLTPSPSPTPIQTTVPPVSSHMTTLNLNRAPPPSHTQFSRSTCVAQRNPTQQRSAEQHNPNRAISAPENTNPPPSEETSAERKRRLARERQRRRRKRLKADSEVVVTVPEVPNTVSNTRQNTNDVQREQGTAQLDLQLSVRGSDTINNQPQALPPQFDSGNLASSNAFATSLQPLQVAAASHPQEDIMNGPSGRNAFNAHSLNMTGAISNGTSNRNNIPVSSSVGLNQNTANEMPRYQANTVDRVPPQQPPENPEQRKRRLARERQRRRRSRLRSKKEGVEVGEGGEREANNTANRIMENTEPREHNDMRRRDLVTEAAQEANRAPMPTPSGVFARTDVGQPLSFDQGRQVRAGMSDGMGFMGGNSIQLPQVPVVSSPPNQGLMPWDSIFESEGSAKNAVHSAVEGFLQRIENMRPDVRAYILQHGSHMLSQYSGSPQEVHRGMIMGGSVMNMRPEPGRHQYVIPNVSTE